MKKFIVTTTINSITEATRKFTNIALRDKWTFVIVGDMATPHAEYEQLEKMFYPHVIYLHPKKQHDLLPELSDMLGWKTIQRRNIGFKYAFILGADIVATVDDDNIPYDDWGRDLYIGKEIEVDYWHSENDVFDPLSVTNHSELWHRGYPVEYLQKRHNVFYAGKKIIKPLIQADLWDGDPDIDAICRLAFKPVCKFTVTKPFASNSISPFNSQNTFIHKDALKHYAVWPYIGRMDDIWGGYYTQKIIGTDKLIYNRASVYQNRNPQDLIKNLENEIIGYRNTLNFLNTKEIETIVPEKTQQFLNEYFKIK
jgi:hypothetical protein